MSRIPDNRMLTAALKRLHGRVVRTPLVHVPSISSACGCEVWLKCEHLQHTHAFKYRGALNAVLSLTAQQRRCGVITHSSGNHGKALAAVASQLGISCTVVVPRNAPRFKRAAIRQYGAKIVPSGATLAAREETMAQEMLATGAQFVPPYDAARVIAGQSTIGVEIAEQNADLDEIWTPVGGGGLASGTVLSVGDHLQVVGAEPLLAADAQQSLSEGRRMPAWPPRTVADGLRTALGELNFRILYRYGLPIYTVDEDEILQAQDLLSRALEFPIEPSSSVPLAALLRHGVHRPSSRRVAIVVTGGMIEVE